MANKWITHTKAYAAKNNMSYSDALKDSGCKAEYRKDMGGSGVMLTSLPSKRVAVKVKPAVMSEEDLAKAFAKVSGKGILGSVKKTFKKATKGADNIVI
jgi:hypothetical protein